MIFSSSLSFPTVSIVFSTGDSTFVSLFCLVVFICVSSITPNFSSLSVIITLLLPDLLLSYLYYVSFCFSSSVSDSMQLIDWTMLFVSSCCKAFDSCFKIRFLQAPEKITVFLSTLFPGYCIPWDSDLIAWSYDVVAVF